MTTTFKVGQRVLAKPVGQAGIVTDVVVANPNEPEEKQRAAHYRVKYDTPRILPAHPQHDDAGNVVGTVPEQTFEAENWVEAALVAAA